MLGMMRKRVRVRIRSAAVRIAVMREIGVWTDAGARVGAVTRLRLRMRMRIRAAAFFRKSRRKAIVPFGGSEWLAAVMGAIAHERIHFQGFHHPPARGPRRVERRGRRSRDG